MEYLQTHFIFSVILIIIVSLAIGSFLNVVIVRYPEMLMRQWQIDCREFLNLPLSPSDQEATAFNLAVPRSHCPSCKHKLSIGQNIPLFSFLFLRGKCQYCQQPISLQYPLVELITLVVSLAVFFHFGWQFKTFAIWLMSYCLIVLSVIDFKTQFLPDDITISLLWLGLLLNTISVFTPLNNAVISAICSYLLLFIVAWLFKLIRKKQGMGNGDFKMLAMFGAWIGFPGTLRILILAIVTSLIVNLGLLFLKKIHHDQPLPFGPWLAFAGWIILVTGWF